MDYRERIIVTGRTLFMKYGIRTVTMDMIARELGISKRTIYEHFKDKDDLLMNVITDTAKQQKEIFYRLMAESTDVIDLIFKIIMTAFDQIRDARPVYYSDLRKYHFRVYEKVCKRGDLRNSEMSLAILRRGVDEGIFRSDINIDIVNEGLQSFIDSAHDNDLLSSPEYSGHEMLDNLLISYIRGISTDKGIKLIDRYRKTKWNE